MKKKHFIIIAVVVALVILLAPVRINIKDGGSIMYKSLVYEVTQIHQLAMEADSENPYIDGWEVKLFGITVYRETNRNFSPQSE